MLERLGSVSLEEQWRLWRLSHCAYASLTFAQTLHDKQILRSHGGEESETSSRVQLEHTGYLK